LVAQALQGIEREDVGREPRLHVAAAPAIEPAALDPRLEGRVAPHRGGPRRHDVDMAVEDEGAAFLFLWMMAADDVDGVFIGDRDRRKARMALDRADLDREAIHPIAALLERAIDEGLGGVLLAPQGRMADELLDEGDLIVEAGFDRFQNRRRQGIVPRVVS
jgi:hypothetical protein